MYKKDGDKEAAVAALQDLHTAMFHGKVHCSIFWKK